ncbi:MAG TPA: hypothetical protein PLV55_06050 [Anaerohalosphaeraceae bacterium]|nr:hypothetical protein [Anaerohalosphaeraceae bacterium]
MSKEIWTSFPAGTLYAFRWNESGQVYNTSTMTDETYNVSNWSQYAITLVQTGAMYVGDFPSGSAGKYKIQIFLQSGASPASTDTPIAQGLILWDGTKEITEKENYDNTSLLLIHKQTVNTVETVQETETRTRIYI